ncbi:zinc-dependent metalloprotease [Tamlana fucoidanivorans]|nr:zinc-dependent metalloprotease [Tamlana fucoidanivorans]
MCVVINAQDASNLGCDTETPQETLAYINSIKPQIKYLEQEYKKLNSTKKHQPEKTEHPIPIKFHIIRNSEGTEGLTSSEVESALENLNSIYAETFFKFFAFEDINFINQSDYFEFKKGDEKAFISAHYEPNIINIYFINYIENASGNSICGYSINDENKHIIVMKNLCALNDSSLAHEMGHIFSLSHTHGPSNTKLTTELVDGSNCDTDGDGICDTPADPMLSLANVNNFCEYTGTLTDAHGAVFTPDTHNIMSYSRKACRTSFSPMQLARMYAYFQSTKENFINSEKQANSKPNEDAETHLRIYPNPIKDGSLQININTSDDLHYFITNIQGQRLQTGRIQNNQIDVSILPAGSYVLFINHSNNQIIKRFIKQ